MKYLPIFNIRISNHTASLYKKGFDFLLLRDGLSTMLRLPSFKEELKLSFYSNITYNCYVSFCISWDKLELYVSTSNENSLIDLYWERD